MEINDIWPGNPYPLGATWDGEGTNFALFSENAEGVELCLFDTENDAIESARIKITERMHFVWHVYLNGIKPGQLYGYRVYGKYDPQNGWRFNPNKLLIDPYAKAIAGIINWDDALCGYQCNHPDKDLSFDETNSAPFLPKCVVIDPSFDWENDKPPGIPYHNTIIYELHVKGFTKIHKRIPAQLRGTYAALIQPEVIDYFHSLGITAIELMPVHQFAADQRLTNLGLINYWGYNTIGFFSPDCRYSSSGVMGQQVNEFKNMVKILHKEGFEVIIDVVYNHTAESNHLGPTLSFRGIDNISYYRLSDHNYRLYKDYTGTGNTLNTMNPGVLRLIMDSLRYWILEMHVDGFRFDLAATLARELHEVDKLSAFFDIIHQDPVISQVKLIAEPWDIGEGGYRVGEFPPGWTEWNGKYRDCIRDYWKGAGNKLGEFANRITGSSDLYYDNWRRPIASINFITAHDGFTLNDLVSYNEKYNMANGENNRDGENNNLSWNCGVEGQTNEPEIIRLRNRQKRNFIATLFLSQGVPMLLAGDEIGHTQKGNNNAYCQDNEISWINWEKPDAMLFKFTKTMINFRQNHPVFRRQKWFQGRQIHGKDITDIAWFLPEGTELNEFHWKAGYAKSLAIFLNGMEISSKGQRGERILDDNFYLIFNAYHEHLDYKLPVERWGKIWKKIIDTNVEIQDEDNTLYYSGDSIKVEGRSIVILICIDSKIFNPNRNSIISGNQEKNQYLSFF